MIAAPPHTKQHSTTVAAIDAAFIRNGFFSWSGGFEAVAFEAVAEAVIAVVDLAESDVVMLILVGVCDKVMVLALIRTVDETGRLLEESSSSVIVEVTERSEKKSSISVIESSVISGWKTSTVDGKLLDGEGWTKSKVKGVFRCRLCNSAARGICRYEERFLTLWTELLDLVALWAP